MRNAVTIINQSLAIKEYEGQRVITFADVDRVHERKEGTASKNFQRNKKHFVKGVDYFEICRQEVGDKLSLTYGFSKLAPKGILLTESGYLMIAKSMTDDLSWKVQRALVNAYFQVKTIVLSKSMEDTFINTYLPNADEQTKLMIRSNLETIRSLNGKIEQDKPKVLFANAVETSQTSILVGDLAKLIQQNGVPMGQKRLFNWMREKGFLIKGGSSKNMPTQKAMERGLFEVKERTISNPDGSVMITKTPKVTGKGQIYFIKKLTEVAV